jgi:hypothetical protein
MVQLTKHINVVKIGYSKAFTSRRDGLRAEHGPLRYILVIPHEEPGRLERSIHEQFASMRLYKGASPTELFQFSTKRQQRFLERFLAKYATCCIELVVWRGKHESIHETKQQTLL